MSGWMKRDGVLSSFHFNVFSDNMQIRSPYAPPPDPLKINGSTLLAVVRCDWIEVFL